jgi:hypothetical protein
MKEGEVGTAVECIGRQIKKKLIQIIGSETTREETTWKTKT